MRPGAFRVVLTAADKEAGGVEVAGLQVFGAEGHQLAAAAERIEADRDEDAVADACEISPTGIEKLIAQVSGDAQRLVGALRLEAPGAADGEVDFDVAGRIVEAQLDGAGPRLPVPVAITVALGQPQSVLLAIRGAGGGAHLQLHQSLGGSVHHVVGHRSFLESGWCEQPDPYRGTSMTARGSRSLATALLRARASGFATAELYHHAGNDQLAPWCTRSPDLLVFGRSGKESRCSVSDKFPRHDAIYQRAPPNVVRRRQARRCIPQPGISGHPRRGLRAGRIA